MCPWDHEEPITYQHYMSMTSRSYFTSVWKIVLEIQKINHFSQCFQRVSRLPRIPLKILYENVVFLDSNKIFLEDRRKRGNWHWHILLVSNMFLMIRRTRCEQQNTRTMSQTILIDENVKWVMIFCLVSAGHIACIYSKGEHLNEDRKFEEKWHFQSALKTFLYEIFKNA